MNLSRKISAFSILLLCVVLLLSGCKSSVKVTHEQIYALDTIIDFTVYSEDSSAIDLAEAEINRLEALLSVTNPDSDISRINTNNDMFVSVSDECFELISTAKSIAENTDGLFDISVYPALKLWGFTTSEYKVPSVDEIIEVKDFIGYNNIELDTTSKSVKIPHGYCLDLGGIAKGYISDKAAEILRAENIDSAILSLGGNIRLIGTKSHNEEFSIGIKSPDKNGYFAILSASDINISTAGGYERYFEENGVRYHHILNPFTASPAETDVLSATVIGENGDVCDALSTAIFVAGSKELSELSEKYPDYSFIVLTDDTVYISSAIADDFELTSNYKDIKINVI